MKALLKNARIQKGIRTRELAQIIGIDQALISKFESGQRIPTKEQVKKLANALSIPIDELHVVWLKEKILNEVGNDYLASKALQLVQEEIANYERLPAIQLSKSLKKLLAK
jgi:transcriptional regulator with XRE-family HTH domain